MREAEEAGDEGGIEERGCWSSLLQKSHLGTGRPGAAWSVPVVRPQRLGSCVEAAKQKGSCECWSITSSMLRCAASQGGRKCAGMVGDLQG